MNNGFVPDAFDSLPGFFKEDFSIYAIASCIPIVFLFVILLVLVLWNQRKKPFAIFPISIWFLLVFLSGCICAVIGAYVLVQDFQRQDVRSYTNKLRISTPCPIMPCLNFEK